MPKSKSIATQVQAYQQTSPKQRFRLASIDPDAKPMSTGDRERDKAAVVQLADELDALQMVFYADRRYKLLVVLQGMDTSGKDGTLRDVFGRMSPLGVRVVGWKAPTEEERSHDPWWRIHRAMPGSGEIVVFNRSHYEDVLVPVVNGQLTPKQIEQRYRQINELERMLTEHGTVVCKFMLHISKDEQRERLQARLDDPSKHWKFDVGDLDVRKRWKEYMAAYDAAIRATLRAVARQEGSPRDLAEYGVPLGFRPLREVLARRLNEIEIPAAPDRLLLTDSASQAIDLVCPCVVTTPFGWPVVPDVNSTSETSSGPTAAARERASASGTAAPWARKSLQGSAPRAAPRRTTVRSRSGSSSPASDSA